MDGFSFAGIHSSEYDCYYHPDAKARGDGMEEYEVEELTADGRDGGYYIGARVKPRTFEQDCYFEDIPKDKLDGIYRWLDRRDSGDLIFDDRQYIAYRVHPTKRIQISLYSSDLPEGTRYSGTFTAVFTCYDPFGRLLKSELDAAPTEAEVNETGLLPAEMTPEAPSNDRSIFLLYNPGTEAGHTIFRIAGNVGNDGLLIRNLTTGQKCKVVNLKDSSLLEGACLELDSEKCQTRITLGNESELAFPFHDEGYITLAPCLPFVRSIAVSHTAGSNTVTSDGAFSSRMKGQYLFLDGWKCIRQVTDANTVILSESIESAGTTKTPVVTMNEIEITGGEGLTRFEVECQYRSR